MCKRKCTTGDKLHQTHSQEHRPCVMHALPPSCYYYLGTQPGVMVCQLFPAVCTGTRHQHPGTMEGLWGRERRSAVSMWLHVWSGGAGIRREHVSHLLLIKAELMFDEQTQFIPVIRHKLHLMADCAWH